MGERATEGLLSRSYRATTIGFVAIVSLIAFETLAVGTAMPTIVGDLHGLDLYGWVFTSLLMANVIGVALGGQLCDHIGSRLGLLLGVASLATGLITAGLATTMMAFLLGRAIQGFGGGLVIVSLYVLAAHVYEEQLRPRLFAVEAAAWVAPAMVGPFLAGLAVDHFTWRALFLTIAPLTIASTCLMWPASANAPRQPITIKALTRIRRWLLAVPAALGLAAIQLAGQRLAWTTAVLAAIGITALAVTLPRLLPPGVFSAHAGVPVIILCRGLVNGAYNGIIAYVPLMLTTIHDYNATAAGLPLTLGTLGWAAASWLQSRLHRATNRAKLRAGFAFLGASGVLLATVAADLLPAAWSYPIWIIGGAGVGTVFPTLAVLLLKHSPAATRGTDSAGFSMAETMAAAITVGLGGSLIAAAEQHLIPIDLSLTITLLLMSAIATAGAITSSRADPKQRSVS